MRKFLALLAALTLFLGACGSDDDTSTAADDGAEVDGETDGEAADDEGNDTEDDGAGETDDDSASDADDQARLDAIIDEIDAAAVALGYTTERSPADEDDADDTDDTDLTFESEECQEADEIFNRLDEQYPETAASESLDANRGEFTAPDSEIEQLSVELSSFSSSDDIDAAFEALLSVPLADCMREAFASESGDEFEIDVESVDVTEGDRGDREIAITIQATFSGGGFEIAADLLFTFVSVDRHAVFFSALAFNSSPSADALSLLDATVEALQ